MARLTVPDVPASASFTVTTAQTVFPFTFPVFAKADLVVSVGGVELAQSAFTLSGTLADGGGYQSGNVTLNVAAENTAVIVARYVRPVRTSNFAPAATTPVGAVDQAFNRITATQQDLARRQADARARMEAAIAEAGASLGNVNKLDRAAGLSDLVDINAGRITLRAPRMYTNEQYGGAQNTAAYAALLANDSYFHSTNTEVVIDLTPYFAGATTTLAKNTAMQTVVDWASRIVGNSTARVVLVLPDGLTNVGATNNFLLRGKECRKLTIRASAAPDFINITGLSSVSTGDALNPTERLCTAVVASALPARVVPDYIMGHQEIEGDNDARFYRGAIRVVSIAADRLSYTFKRLFRVTPVDPTAMVNGGTVNTRLRSVCVVPRASFVGAWEAADEEGLFTIRDGAVLETQWVGWGATDTGAQGTVFGLAGAGARLYSIDYDCFLSAGDRAIRAFAGADVYLNRACLGADSRPSTSHIVGCQGYATLQVTRCDFGGGRVGCVEVANNGSGYFGGGCNFHGGSTAAISARGGYILAYPTQIDGAEVGGHAVDGGYLMLSNDVSQTTIRRCNKTLDAYGAGSVIRGPVVEVSNVVGPWARPDMTRKGATYATRQVNPIDAGRDVSVANGARKQAPLRGTIGTVTITARNEVVSAWIAIVSGGPTAGGTSVSVHLGSDVRNSIAAGATPLADGATDLMAQTFPINAGRHTYGVFANSGSPYLQIVNEDGADRIYDIIVTGDLELGVFA